MGTQQQDFGNILRAVYDQGNEALQVSIIGSGSPTMPNSVRLSDGVSYLTSTVAGAKRSLDVAIQSMPDLVIDDTTDSIRIGNGAGNKLEVNVDGSINTKTTAVKYISLIDDSVVNTTYVGNAVPSSSTSAAVWQILKIVSSGTSTSILYAGGSDSFTNIWNNRTSLVYA